MAAEMKVTEADQAHWKVGEFWASSNPYQKVLVLSVGSAIDEHEKHPSFIRWVYAHPTDMESHREVERLCCKAFDDIFGHCVSNGIFNAWGQALDCTSMNEAMRALTNLRTAK